jgi:hypothetical protein
LPAFCAGASQHDKAPSPAPLQLSLATNAINLLGCLVRIFTTIQEKAGAAMLYGFLLGGRASGAVADAVWVGAAVAAGASTS